MDATIKDVAEEADVSVATVSRVFNDSTKVREMTRRRVLEAARALRYVPNQAARNLIMSRTQTIGVLLPDMHGEFFAQVIRGLDKTARAHDYHLLVSSSHSEEDEARTMVRAMLGRVDGLIIMWPPLDTDFFADLIPEGLPTVLLTASEEPVPFNTLSIDNYGGAQAIVEHLLDHGHERIAILTGPPGNRDARERLEGYRDALRESRAGYDPKFEIPGDFMRETGAQAVPHLLAVDPRPTALFASNDSMAIGALSALREAGARIPDDIAVVGFDDIPSAQYVTPSLSTVHVPIYELGARSAELLLHRIGREPEEGERHDVLPTELTLRASCGCRNAE